MNENWKIGLAVGAGLVLGVIGVIVVSKGKNGNARRACAALLSHGLDVKDKVMEVLETAKENVEDLAAEARHESDLRREEEIAGEIVDTVEAPAKS